MIKLSSLKQGTYIKIKGYDFSDSSLLGTLYVDPECERACGELHAEDILMIIKRQVNLDHDDLEAGCYVYQVIHSNAGNCYTQICLKTDEILSHELS